MAKKMQYKLDVLMGVKTEKLVTGLKNAERSLNKFSRSATRIGKTLSVSLTAPMAAFSAVSLKAFDTQAKAEAQLLTALKGNKKAFEDLTKQASELQSITLFGDEETIRAQALIAAFVKEEHQIKRIMPLVQDLAAAKGMDLAGAADLVSKTLGSSTNAMSRYGIEVKGAVGSTERLESLANSLTEAFGGQAKAMAEVGTGPLTQLKNQLGDLGEEFGRLIAIAIKPFIARVKEIVSVFQGLEDSTKLQILKWGALAAAVGPAVFAFGTMAGAIGKVMAALRVLSLFIATNPLGAIAAAVAAIGTVFYVSTRRMSAFEAKLKALKDLNAEVAKRMVDHKVKVKELADAVKDETRSEKERIAALQELKKLSPDIFGHLDLSKEKIDSLKTSVETYLETLRKQIRLEAARERLVELHKKLIDLRNENDPSFWEHLRDAVTGLAIMPGNIAIGKELAKIKREGGEVAEVLAQISELEKVLSKDRPKTPDELDDPDTPLPKQSIVTIPERTVTPIDVPGTTQGLEKIAESAANVSVRFDGMKDSIEKVNESTSSWYESASAIFSNIGSAIGSLFADWATGAENAAESVRRSIGKIIEALISQGITAIISRAFVNAGPLALALAPALAGMAKGMFNSLVPAFAKGGLVHGPTLAMVGDNPNAMNDPEVIAPLSKLKGMMGSPFGGGGGGELVAKINGNDLFIMLQNVGQKRNSF